MKIALDISPIKDTSLLAHRVRGTGFYIENLKKSLLKYCAQNQYIFYTRGEKLPSDTDIVHIPYFEPFFLTLPLFSKNKIIVTVHDLTPLVFPQHFKTGIKGSLKWQMQKASLRNASAIITDSQSSRNDIIKYTGIKDSKIHVIYLAAGEEFRKMEDGRWKMEIRKKYNLPEEFALYVGDVTWNKNLPRLLEAIAQVDVPMVMAGKALVEKDFDKNSAWNQDLVRIQNMAQQYKKITRLGFIPTEDLVLLYNAATLFVMPSIYEGFGLPILEAMSCGCPVVASKDGSLSEIVGKAGKYVDPYDIDNIAAGIREVFNSSSLRKELSSKGVNQSKKFTWRKTADGTMDVYKRIIGDAKNIL